MVTGKVTKTTVAMCPDCEKDVALTGQIEWGQQVVCPHCDTELEVISTNPVELDWAYEEFDFDDYDDEDDDY